MTFKNKVAFVSGAAGDIGYATAKAFAQAGAAVAVTDCDDAAATSVAQELIRRGHRALAVACDVTNEDSVANAIERTVKELGWLDAAFNDAGVHVPSAQTADAPAADFDRAVAANLRGVWLFMKHQLRRMRQQGSGAIVNCTSRSGQAGSAGLGAHMACKHGVFGLTRAAATEYARMGIRVNGICPDANLPNAAGTASSNDNLLRRIGTPAETILWLCGPGARFMIGQILAPVAATANASSGPFAFGDASAAPSSPIADFG